MSDYIKNVQETTLTKAQAESVERVDDDVEYFRSLAKDAAKTKRLVIGKERRYVNDYSDVPDGATLQEGPQEGLFYETEEVQEFQEDQQARTESILSEHDFSEEQIQRAEELHREYAEAGEGIFGNLMDTAIEAGVDMAGAAYRTKGVGSMARKAYVRDNDYEDVNELKDIFGGMIKPQDADGVNTTAESLKEAFGEDRVIEEKDYMEEPQGGYYRARHLILETEDGKRAEVQIKSPELSDVASVGHALVFKNEEAEDVPTLDDETKEDVRDCLTQLSGVIVGQQAEHPDCTTEATSLINDTAEKVEVA